MAQRRVPIVLVTTPNDGERQAIMQALSAQGIEVKIARDGGRALEVAVLEQPDLVVFDAESSVLDAPRFCEILRGNPRTEKTPVIVTGYDARPPNAPAGTPAAPAGGLGLAASFIARPFTVEALANRVRELLRRRSAAAQVADTAATSVVQGNLAEIALVDLLQIFVMNRKEGRLLLAGESGGPDAAREGEIHLKSGQIVHARLGSVEGTKALYRLLHWRRGRFSWQPGQTSPVRTIKSPPDAVVMEGMRQADEVARIADRRPPDRARVLVTMDRKGLPEDLHKTTREVLALTEFYSTVGEILDRSTSTDFEVLRALILLEEKQVLKFDLSAAQNAPPMPPLIDGESLIRLRSRLLASGGMVATWKVIVFTKDRATFKRFLGPFARLPGFDAVTDFFATTAANRPPIGAAARVPLAEGHHLEIVACPTHELYRPLLGLFGERALAGIVVQEGDEEGIVSLAAQVGEALGSEAIPLDLGTFAPVIGPPSDGTEARALITHMVQTALKSPRALETNPRK